MIMGICKKIAKKNVFPSTIVRRKDSAHQKLQVLTLFQFGLNFESTNMYSIRTFDPKKLILRILKSPHCVIESVIEFLDKS